MFQHNINSFTYQFPPADGFSEDQHARHYNTALNRFKSALVKGRLSRLKRLLMDCPRLLYDLNAIKPELSRRGSFYSGIQVVRISSIIGSEGKTDVFDMGFHPLHEDSRERWVGMAMAYLSRLPLPPVQLVQIGNAYFVRDGHHRISVSRAFGQTSMDAEVVTWQATPPFPWQPDAKAEETYPLKRLDPTT